MNQEILDLYADYLISSFGPTTATGMSKLLRGALSHDQVTRMLASPKMTNKNWWRKIKPRVRAIERSDGVLIIEAPDDETAHKVSLISRSEGALTAESWPALPYDRFLKVLEEAHPQ